MSKESQSDEKASRENEEPESSIRMTIPSRTEYIPGLILEQCMHIRATLSAMLTLQCDLVAHLTSQDPNALRDEYLDRLSQLNLEIARQMEVSLQNQPPLDE